MMARALMTEILTALEELATAGRVETIDLRSLPLSPSDRSELEALLGAGEVTATIRSAGETEVLETQFPGVWWVRHRGSGGNAVFEAIEVTQCPELLRTPDEDVTDSVRELRALLAEKGEDDHAMG